jgi:hypothetical protein
LGRLAQATIEIKLAEVEDSKQLVVVVHGCSTIDAISMGVDRDGNGTGLTKTRPRPHQRPLPKPTCDHTRGWKIAPVGFQAGFLGKHNYFNISIICMSMSIATEENIHNHNSTGNHETFISIIHKTF